MFMMIAAISLFIMSHPVKVKAQTALPSMAADKDTAWRCVANDCCRETQMRPTHDSKI
jgi:hypothetical protein